MSSKICFISNFYLTELYEKVAIELKKKDCEIFWICPNKPTYERLSKKWGSNNVLYIGMSSVVESSLNAPHYSAEINDVISNDILIRDRILKYRSSQGAKYLQKLKYVAFDFLTLNNIESVFGELTWSHEVLINRICLQVTECKTTYYNPHSLRIPQQTFGFFLDEFQSNLSQHKTSEGISGEMRTRYFTSIVDEDNELPPPDYLKLNDQIVKKANSFTSQIEKLYKLFFKPVDQQDPTLETSTVKRLIDGGFKFFKAKVYKLVKKHNLDDIKDKKYFLYPLHKQPEASVDVIGKYYDDQLLNIRNIASQLKDDEFLIVKEHSNAIGDRNYSFYNSLANYPRVLLVDDAVNIKILIKDSLGVFTVSGTAAFEASLMGVDSFCFSNVYFRKLASCHVISLENFNRGALIIDPKETQLTKKDFVDEMLKSACNGIISNPKSDIRCIHQENVNNLAQEFYAVIQR